MTQKRTQTVAQRPRTTSRGAVAKRRPRVEEAPIEPVAYDTESPEILDE